MGHGNCPLEALCRKQTFDCAEGGPFSAQRVSRPTCAQPALELFVQELIELLTIETHHCLAGLCPPCRAEMSGFQRVYDDLGDRYVMVGVDIGPFVGLGSHDDARQFLKEFDIRYPTAYAVSGGPVRDYNVQGMPTTVFLTPDKQIFYKRVGFLPEDELRSKLQDLLAASS